MIVKPIEPTTITVVKIKAITRTVTRTVQSQALATHTAHLNISAALVTPSGHPFSSRAGLPDTQATFPIASFYSLKPTGNAYNYYPSVNPLVQTHIPSITPSSSPFTSSGIAEGSSTPLAQSQYDRQSSGNGATSSSVIALAVLLAITSTLLLVVLVGLYRRRRPRASHRMLGDSKHLWSLNHEHSAAFPPDVEKEAKLQRFPDVQTAVCDDSDSSNVAVLPSIPSRAMSRISSRFTRSMPVAAILPSCHSLREKCPHYSNTHMHTRPVTHILHCISHLPFNLLKRGRASDAGPSPVSEDVVSSPATLGPAISRDDGYPSSMKATIDSINTSRFSCVTSYYPHSPIPSDSGSSDIVFIAHPGSDDLSPQSNFTLPPSYYRREV